MFYSTYKKMAAMVFCLTLLCAAAVPAGAEQIWPPVFHTGEDAVAANAEAGVPDAVALTCKAGLLMNAETGKVIYAKNENERLAEASITKIMTMLLVFEALDAGRITPDEITTCSEHAASMGGSQIWLEVGEQMSVDDLVKAAMVGSANDACVVLAELIAGTHENFVIMMNERAAQLGMANTAYKNCTGLDADGHLTSALDVAICTAELLKHEKVLEYSTIWMDSLRGGELQLSNTNRMLRSYSGCIGMKTGTTSQAGCCVSAVAQREGMTLISVVLGGANSDARFGEAAKMLDYGFAKCEIIKLDKVPVATVDIPVSNGMAPRLPTYVDMSGSVLIPKGKANDVVVSVNMLEEIAAPVEADQIVGTVTLSVGSEIIGDYNIMVLEGVDKITFGNVFAVVIKGLLKI